MNILNIRIPSEVQNSRVFCHIWLFPLLLATRLMLVCLAMLANALSRESMRRHGGFTVRLQTEPQKPASVLNTQSAWLLMDLFRLKDKRKLPAWWKVKTSTKASIWSSGNIRKWRWKWKIWIRRPGTSRCCSSREIVKRQGSRLPAPASISFIHSFVHKWSLSRKPPDNKYIPSQVCSQ